MENKENKPNVEEFIQNEIFERGPLTQSEINKRLSTALKDKRVNTNLKDCSAISSHTIYKHLKNLVDKYYIIFFSRENFSTKSETNRLVMYGLNNSSFPKEDMINRLWRNKWNRRTKYAFYGTPFTYKLSVQLNNLSKDKSLVNEILYYSRYLELFPQIFFSPFNSIHIRKDLRLRKLEEIGQHLKDFNAKSHIRFAFNLGNSNMSPEQRELCSQKINAFLSNIVKKMPDGMRFCAFSNRFGRDEKSPFMSLTTPLINKISALYLKCKVI